LRCEGRKAEATKGALSLHHGMGVDSLREASVAAGKAELKPFAELVDVVFLANLRSRGCSFDLLEDRLRSLLLLLG